MYKITYEFSLDIADKFVKELCEKMGSAYPFVSKGLKQALTISNLKDIPTDEETKIIKESFKNIVKGREVGNFVVIDVHFERIVEVVKEENSNDKNKYKQTSIEEIS